MKHNYARFIKIKIIEDGNKKINITIPLFLLIFPLRLIPAGLIQHCIPDDKVQDIDLVELKKLIISLKAEGNGTRVFVKDDDTVINIELY